MKTRKMRRCARVIVTALLLGGAAMAPAFGQGMVVHDPANVAQNVLQAARALQQVNNQIKQLENEVLMLKRLDLQMAPDVVQSIGAARELFSQAQAIRYNLGTIAADLRALYPDDYKDLGVEEMLKRSDLWIAQSRSSLQSVLEQQARAATALEAAQHRTGKALDASGGAEGQTSAVQAGNQILGVLSQQLADMQALQIAQSRALTEEKLERAAREARALEIQRKAFPTTRTLTGKGAGAPPARSVF